MTDIVNNFRYKISANEFCIIYTKIQTYFDMSRTETTKSIVYLTRYPAIVTLVTDLDI